jgi:hypothetical protein
MRGLRARAFGAGAVVVALAAVALAMTALPAIADPSQPGTFTAEEIAAGRDLLSHVPADFRLTCRIETLDKVPEPEGIIADVTCSPDVKAIAGIEYEQFDSQVNVDTEYANQLSDAEGKPPSGCLGDAGYSINGQEAGRVACFRDSLGTYIDYTYTPLLVVASISQFGDTPGAPDITALNDFSNNQAGPNSAAEEIPSLLSDAEAQQAVSKLVGHLKPAIAKHCTAENPEANPWKSVSLSCEKPTKGVFTASYDQYRDDDSYAGAFDPDALAKLSVKKNKSCPASGTWSTDGKTQGKYACWIDQSKTTHLVWGVDSQRIVASAFAQSGDGFTSAQFLHWWDTKGSITP